jgi:RecB family endonuclease NucS
MLRLDRAVKKLIPLQSKKLADAGLLERHDIQQLIFANPDAFFNEIGETLWLIGQEIVPSDEVGDAIDLLAIDEDGNAVILELNAHATNSIFFRRSPILG